jgi:hypothetical protein
MIAAVFQDYGRIVRASTLQRHPRLLKIVAGLVLLLLIGLVAAGLAGILNLPNMAPAPTARFAAFGLLFVLVFVWALAHMPGSVLMHSAPSARLLPRQRRRFIELAYGSWVLMSAVAGLLMENWGAALILGTMSLAFGLTYSGRPAGLLLFLPYAAWMAGMSRLPPSATAVLTDTSSLQAMLALQFVVGWFALRAQYPVRGGEQLRERTERAQMVFSGNVVGTHMDGPVGRLLAAGSPRGTLLGRACRRRDPVALLAHGLGPAMHWMSANTAAFVILAIFVVAELVVPPLSKDAAQGALNGFISSAVIAIVMQGMVYRKQLVRYRAEGALLRLTPLLGDATLLNRRLATALLKAGLLSWMLLTAMDLTALAFLGGSARQFATVLAICCAGCQFLLPKLLDDFARRPTLTVNAVLYTAAIIVAEAVVIVCMGALSGVDCWPWFAPLAAVVCAIQLRLNWRRMLAAPAALPVGRMEETS